MIADRIRNVAHAAEGVIDRTKRRIVRKFGLGAAPMIAPYFGFVEPQGMWVRARVLEDQGVVTALHSDSLVTNLRHTWKRYETDELPDARLRWSYADALGEVTSDEEGFVDFHIPADEVDASAAWQDVHLELLEVPGRAISPLGATVRVRTPGQQAEFGIISDIDDTIVHTGAMNFIKHWRTVVANSAESRRIFPNVAALYRDLTQGQRNPIFYVSSSPWNLFDLFERYMVLNDLPLGPMLLKDFGLTADSWLTGGHDGHKTKAVERILAAHPGLDFVLIGDSGQRDLPIYTALAEKHPGRVRAVLLHDVTDQVETEAEKAMLSRLDAAGIPHAHCADYDDARPMLRSAGVLAP